MRSVENISKLLSRLQEQVGRIQQPDGEIFDSDTLNRMLTEMGYRAQLNEVLNTVEVVDDNNHAVNINKVAAIILDSCKMKRCTAEYLTVGFRVLAESNPVNPFLTSIPKWDGTDYIARFFEEVLPIDEAQREPFCKWLYGLIGLQVRRHLLSIRHPKMDRSLQQQWRPQMMIMYGDQGLGKNFLLSSLGHPYVVDGLRWEDILKNNRDSHRRVKRSVLAVWDEDPTAHGFASALVKSFISSPYLPTRGMFERYDDPDDFIVSSFAGTTNDPQCLHDPTGSRRFLVIDARKLKRTKNWPFTELLSQVKHYVEHSEDLYPWLIRDRISLKKVTETNEPFSEDNLFSDIVAEAITSIKGPVTLHAIRDAIGDEDARRYYLGRGDTRRLVEDLKLLGYERSHGLWIKRLKKLPARE